MPEPNNADIARWMGEYRDKAVRDWHGSDCGRAYAGPDYPHDPGAALRVLEKMSKHSNCELFYWSPTKTWVCSVEKNGQRDEYTAPTPCAAIGAAWAVEFGGEHE